MRAFLLLMGCVLAFSACDPKDPGGIPGFDRAAMLQHYADRFIIPAYDALKTNTDALADQTTVFVNAPTVSELREVQRRWKDAVIVWQAATPYNVGPAAEAGLSKSLAEEIGTFPANATQIETFIAASDVSFNNFNRDTRGFYAIEYLLFKDSLALLTDAKRTAYLSAAVQHLKAKVDNVRAGWSSYRADFLASTGTDSGSSTSLFYNEFVKSFEQAKNFKVGLPAGKRPGQTMAEPERLEAYYSDNSLLLLRSQLTTLYDVWNGEKPGASSTTGFRTYLQSVTGGPELVSATDAQWQKVIAALDAIPTDRPFAQLMAENHPSVDALHTELQKHTRFFKSDMSSLLGIAITYSSGDGD